MATQPEMPNYIIVDPESVTAISQTAPNEDAARKLAEEMAVNRGRPMYVFQKIGRMVPVQTAKWEGPGN